MARKSFGPQSKLDTGVAATWSERDVTSDGLVDILYVSALLDATWLASDTKAVSSAAEAAATLSAATGAGGALDSNLPSGLSAAQEPSLPPLAMFGSNRCLAPGAVPYLPTNNVELGIGWNPATKNLVLPSRDAGKFVAGLNGTTGAVIKTLDTAGISGATLPLMGVGVSDNGETYVPNLQSGTSLQFATAGATTGPSSGLPNNSNFTIGKLDGSNTSTIDRTTPSTSTATNDHRLSITFVDADPVNGGQGRGFPVMSLQAKRFSLALAALLLIAVGPTTAYAASSTWIGATSGTGWGVETNWSPTGRPIFSSTVVIGASVGSSVTVNNTLANSRTITGLVFQRSGSFTIAPGSGSVTPSLTVTGSVTRTTGATGTHTISASMGVGSMTWRIDGSGALVVSGTISNNGSNNTITKTGTGTLTLTGNNTYSGATTITAGILSVDGLANGGSASSIGQSGTAAGNLMFDGGTLQYTGADVSTDRAFTINAGQTATIQVDTNNLTIAGAAAATTGSLTKTGNGTLTLSGANSHSGTTRSTAGTLAIGNASALQNSTLDMNSGDGGSVTFAQNSTLGALTGSRNVDMQTRVLSIGNSGADSTYAGTLSNGGLTKLGAGKLTLSGSNTYSDGTTISAGTLAVGAGGTAGSIAGSVTNNAALVFDRSDALTYAGSIGGTGSVTKSGAGTLTLSGSNTYSGGTTISAGTLAVGAGGTAGSIAGSVTNNAALVFDRSDALTYSGSIGGTGSVTKSGAGTLTLSGSNTYSGGTTISAGTLAVGSGGTAGSIAGSVTNNAALVFDRSDALTYSGSIGGTGSVTKSGAGTLTLSGSNTYSGFTAVSSGTLKVNSVLGSGSLSVAAAAWLMGTGTINGRVAVNGTLAPGSSPGVISLGSLTLADTSTTIIEIASAGPRGTAYDGISILDANGLTYGGTVSLAFGGSAIANDTTFDILSFTGSSAGALAAVESSGFYAGTWTNLGSGTFRLVSGTQTLTFSQSTGDVIVVPEPATISLASLGLAALAVFVRKRPGEHSHEQPCRVASNALAQQTRDCDWLCCDLQVHSDSLDDGGKIIQGRWAGCSVSASGPLATPCSNGPSSSTPADGWRSRD